MDKWVMCVIALILGMLMANMLKNVCGCKTVEGTDDPCVGGEQNQNWSKCTGYCSSKNPSADPNTGLFGSKSSPCDKLNEVDCFGNEVCKWAITKCPSGTHVNTTKTFCIPTCPSDTYLDPTQRFCIPTCPSGTYLDDTQKLCIPWQESLFFKK